MLCKRLTLDFHFSLPDLSVLLLYIYFYILLYIIYYKLLIKLLVFALKVNYLLRRLK